MGNTILELKAVTSGYGQTHVLEDFNLEITEGEKLAIIGRNGVGKTTTLSTIMGLTDLHSGSIFLKGKNITNLPTHKRSHLGIGVVPQTRDIFESLSVEENLLSCMHKDSSLDDAYSLFPRLKERRNNGGVQLSGGEQQMLSIARTLMARPELILLDEPLEGLAPVICDMLMEVFVELASDGKHTVVLVEQHADLALSFADKVVVLDAGKKIHYGDAKELQNNPDLLNRFIGVNISN